MAKVEDKTRVVIKFAGDSGDGMQLTGNQFSFNTALEGNDIATFPDFPAEIRAPIGTLAGVSGFQLQFGSEEILTPGEDLDVLVAMNAAALKNNLGFLREGGVLILNSDGFNGKNLKLAGYESNPLEDEALTSRFERYIVDVTKITQEALSDLEISDKEKARSKNMFVLGLLYWMYDRSLESTIDFLKLKFAKRPELIEANERALKAG